MEVTYFRIAVSFITRHIFLQLYGFSIIILICMLNLNFACLKFLRLLQDCDVECNPGPRNFAIAKYSGFVPSGMPNLGKLLVFNVHAMHESRAGKYK